MNCTPMAFKKKPLSLELTVPVLRIIFWNLPTPYLRAFASHSPGLPHAFNSAKNSRALNWLLI
jgi:hypothetical protein